MTTRPVDRSRAWPDAVEARLAIERAEAVAHWPDALDLSDPAARDALAAEIDRPGSTARQRAVVSVGELVRFGDLPASLRAIRRLLAPDGVLVAVEPVVPPRALSTVLTAAWGTARSVRGFHLGRDLPAALRATGFDLDDIARSVVRTRMVPLRNLVSVVARPSVDRDPTSLGG